DTSPHTAKSASGEYAIEGGASVFFGGLEFRMKDGDDDRGFALIDAAEGRQAALPEVMILSGEAAHFRLPGGSELDFVAQYTGGARELRISAIFAPGVSGLELPYKPLRTSRIRENGDGQRTFITDGVSYNFGHSTQGEENGLLILKPDGQAISYRAAPAKKTFSPEDFAIAQALTRNSYNEALTRWRDQNFSVWNRIISGQNDEDMVIAYSGEAARRGNYKAAVSAVPPAFLDGSARTFESSVYLGGMTAALTSFTASEREKISRLSRLINDKSPEFIREPHVFEYFGVRGYGNFIDDGAELVRSIDPATLALEAVPGIFEGCLDMKQFRSHGENPFERLTNQACYVVSENIRKSEDGTKVFVFRGNSADIEFNLRLGKALFLWADDTGSSSWAAVGRSLVLSALSLSDGTGAVPADVTLSEAGDISEAGGSRIRSARLYRILAPGEYAPRAAGIGSGVNGLWTWTAAGAVSASQENNVLDITVNFPQGETHYMMIRGVRPFTKIQLYNIDYRTDPQFERYDSSGWIYSMQDQVLVLKMKHRSTAEHIRIFY
ncbi:MAG: hypothetical protein LBN21_10375, partial [Treponema sp.]|nr:hypothetical protein [Treponema sp.]